MESKEGIRAKPRPAKRPPAPRHGASKTAPAPDPTAAPVPVPVPVPGAPATGALGLYAQVLGATTLAAAVHRLVATLADEHGFSRVTFGLHEQGRTRLLASSHGDVSNAQAEGTQRLVGAMDEAIDQALPVAWPVDAAAATAGVADRITFEHAALQALTGQSVASVPLGQGGEVFGALCVQRDGGAIIGADELARLSLLLGLAAPALRWMQQATQPWHRRTAHDLQAAWSTLRQPGRRNTRRLLAGATAVLAFVALAPLQHEVAGRARIEGAEQRVLIAPTDGFIKTAHVRPGDRVATGAPLLDLLEQDLRLELERWRSQLAQHENAHAAAMARADRVAAATSMARVAEAQSQLALIDGQLARGRITAPFDGLVIQGDFSQSSGAPVRRGDTLVTLASTGQYRVIVEVDETDIARVQAGQGGRLALSSLPWAGHDLVVERIAPMARAVDGRNVFEVEARLPAPTDDLRPGLLGRAQLVVGRTPQLWVWLQQAANRIRLSYWAWLG
jgi:multidrug efflux pump subunit AcrA (membrane-fusion protein)